jgi:GntR family transcriptional regulator
MTTPRILHSLDKTSPVPLYRQLADRIEKGIQEGALSEGSRIPSEQEWMHRLGVSRVTVRQAMDSLMRKNIIVRKQGMGTYVRKTVMTQEMDDLFGFYPALLIRGLHPKTDVLTYEIQTASREVRERLDLSAGAKALHFSRQYLLEPSLFVLIHMYFPRDLAARWTRRDASTQSSFRLLRDKAGVQIQSSFITIRASLATAKIAGALRVPKGSPILELQRLRVSSEQRPVEYAVMVFPGEFYELTTTVSAAGKNGIKLDRR